MNASFQTSIQPAFTPIQAAPYPPTEPTSMPAQPPLPPGLPPVEPGFSPVPSGMPGSTDIYPVPPAIPQVSPVPTGTPGVDLVQDLPGDTDLYCGPNQDLLLFQDGSGFDVVYGFDPSETGDLIAIEANVNGTGLQALEQLAVADTEYGALIDLGGGNGFLLAGIPLGQLDASDFMIHPPIDSGAPLA